MSIVITVDEDEIAQEIYMGVVSLGHLLWHVAADQVPDEEIAEFARRVAAQAHAADVTEGRGHSFSLRLAAILRATAAALDQAATEPAVIEFWTDAPAIASGNAR